MSSYNIIDATSPYNLSDRADMSPVPHTVASLKRATAQVIAQAKREEKKATALAKEAAKLKMALRRLEEAKEHTGDVRRAITLDVGGR